MKEVMSTAEDYKSRLLRYLSNVTPVFRATGAWITHVSADRRLVRLELPLKLKTRNPLGTMCGGNMYSAVHGIYLLMLMHALGKDYACVDRLSTIKFLKPGKSTLFTQFVLTQKEIDETIALVRQYGKTDRQYLIELKDKNGMVCSEITCTINVRKKRLDRG